MSDVAGVDALWLRTIKTEKQISESVPHPKREPTPTLVLVAVVNHVAPLAQSLEISRPVVGRVVVKVSSPQHDSGCANRDVVPDSSGKPASAAIAPSLLGFVPPSPVAEHQISRPCGRPHLSQRPWARSNRITAESCGQSIG